MNFRLMAAALAASVALPLGAANATDLEVTHWWTSGGEAAAVAELAKAFDATGNKWVDGAIAGSGGTARPIMISRITGGDPMGATQFNHGRQAEELVQAGLMRDLTDVADRGARGRRSSVRRACSIPARSTARSIARRSTFTPGSGCGFRTPPSRRPAWRFRRTGTNSSLRRRRSKRPVSCRSPSAVSPGRRSGAFDVLMVAIAGKDTFLQGLQATRTRKPRPVRRWPRSSRLPTMRARCRRARNVQDWNQATNMVITGKAGGQIMGDWAQGEFQLAGQKAGTDYTCLPGLGVNEIISTGGDAFYFPLLKDEAKSKAQDVLAKTLLDLEDAGRLQPEEGLAAGARRRRSRRRQRLHEEGSRDPRQGQCHRRDRPAAVGRQPEAEGRPVLRVLRQSVDDAGRRAEALCRDHRFGRLIVASDAAAIRLRCNGAGSSGTPS